MSIDLTCPSGCPNTDLPAITMDVCNPEVHFGNIQKIYFTNLDYPLTNVEDAAEWASRLSNTSTDVNAIRSLHVVGNMDRPEREEVEISLCRKIQSPGQYTVPFTIDETNDENYDFARLSNCNDSYKFWLETEDHIWGGNAGIDAEWLLDPVIPEGCTELQTFVGELMWKATQPPPRDTNVLS